MRMNYLSNVCQLGSVPSGLWLGHRRLDVFAIFDWAFGRWFSMSNGRLFRLGGLSNLWLFHAFCSEVFCHCREAR